MVLAFLGHLLGALAVPLVPLVLITMTGHRMRAALLLYAAALALLIVWVVASYRAGVAADETMTEGSLFAESAWLGLSVAAAVGSAVITLTGRRRAVAPGQEDVTRAQ